MKRLQVPPLTEEQLTVLEELYQKTKTPRYRTRAQIVLLSAEQGYKAEEITQNRSRKSRHRSALAQALHGRRDRRADGCTPTRAKYHGDRSLPKSN
jgi:hypothetical protein